MIYARELEATLCEALALGCDATVVIDRETVMDMIDVLRHVMRDLGGDFSTESTSCELIPRD